AAIDAKAKQYSLAPELIAGGEWLNSEPLTLSQLRGKVVLLDIWTYSCINCIRTLPYVTNWWSKYKDAGLVIIGVHTPEFDFEKDPSNVQKAITKYGIEYPVMQDNNYATWRAYKNQYWPRHYLIDIDGFIREDHIGEGGYAETEEFIQELLQEKNERMGETMDVQKEITTPEGAVTTGQVGTPELYLGAQTRRHNGGNKEGYALGTVDYAIPTSFQPNIPYASGTWTNTPETMDLVSDEGSIYLTYFARNVNIVAGATPGSTIDVYLDGKLVDTTSQGFDAIDGIVALKDQQLYSMVFTADSGAHDLELKVHGKGFRIYTFTFG
ncbi:MAG: redoxin domain-containing protein, partial [Nanoarchaeota archaeon]